MLDQATLRVEVTDSGLVRYMDMVDYDQVPIVVLSSPTPQRLSHVHVEDFP